MAAFVSHLTSSQVTVWLGTWPHLPARQSGLQIPEELEAWGCTPLINVGRVGAPPERRYASVLECSGWATYMLPGSADVDHGN